MAFEALKEMKFEMKQTRKKKPVKTDKKEILQEFAYIVNKQRIKNFIKQKKEREETLLQKMKVCEPFSKLF